MINFNSQDQEIFSPVRITSTENISNTYNVFIDKTISDPEYYSDLITLLFESRQDDEINIFFNTGGGQIDTATSIIEGIKNCDALVTGIIIGECSSAASMIALSCHEISVMDNAYMMVHTSRVGVCGTLKNSKDHMDFISENSNKYFEKVYEGFLTDEELGNMKLGVEYWFGADEIKRRLQNRAEAFNLISNHVIEEKQ